MCIRDSGWWAWRFFREHGRQVTTDPYRIAGIATRTEVVRTASEKALLRRAEHLTLTRQSAAC